MLIHGGRIYIAYGATLFCVDYATGQGLWKTDIPNRYSARPSMLIHGARLYVNFGDVISAFGVDEGNLLWSHQAQTKNLRAWGFPDHVMQEDV